MYKIASRDNILIVEKDVADLEPLVNFSLHNKQYVNANIS